MLSKKSDYALRTIVYLALHREETLSTRKISEKLQIPYKFLTQIMLELSRKEIISSKRGSRGGIFLKKNPEKITLLEVVEAVDGPFAIHHCSADSNEPCFFARNCPIKENLSKLEHSARQVLNNITIDKISSEYLKEKEA
ncbi:MAG: Rrf2 family transcriptional regulator [Actinobacteria bacterium]|nr:Rrf2 family transcriptional regulator [Actinomycetota bacterium]